MPSWLTEVLKLLGFTTPFLYAAATYGFFHFLDKKASGAAKRALGEWLAARLDHTVVTAFSIDVFDRIYSHPLFRWRALARSATITTVVGLVVWLHTGMLTPFAWPNRFWWGLGIIGSGLAFNIVTDYISLFFVRRWLVVTGTNPIFGLVVGGFIGAGIIYLGWVVRVFIMTSVLYLAGKNEQFSITLSNVPEYFIYPFRYSPEVERLLVAPAVAVHLWLPLLAASAVLARALNWMLKAVSWMQWFLKQGQHHPFQAIGYVAAAIVFVVVLSIQVWARG